MAKNKKKKGFSISGIIAALILLGIISEYFTVIIIIGAILLVLGILYLYGKHKASQDGNIMQDSHGDKRIQASHEQTQNLFIKKEQIKKSIDILTDSINLINSSNNLGVVLRRYDMAIDSLNELSAYTESDLNSLGFRLKEPVQNTLCKLQDNKTEILNQAITRNLEHEINSVTKNELKIKHLTTFRKMYENNMLLPPENKNFLIEQYNIYVSKYVPQTYTQIDSINHTVQTLTIYDNKSYDYHVGPDEFISKFYELSSLIDLSKNIEAKIQACEESYPLLKEFCRFCLEEDGELPPVINCRDVGLEMYMRLGKWDDVERVIRICSEANAYYPDNNNEILSYYNDYKRIANLALSYIKDNPGYPQNKMYDALHVTEEDREVLKHFLRCSLQIKKEKSGRTNKLYLA